MAKFEIGEIAIFHRPESSYHGEEVEIYTELMPDGFFVKSDRQSLGECYGIVFFCGTKGWAQPKYLRKKKPPESKDIQETREAIKNGSYSPVLVPNNIHESPELLEE